MNKVLIILALMFFSSGLKAQNPRKPIEKAPKTNLFEYGEPVKSVEDNFKNLFRNFPKLITNAGESFKLLSYKYVTEIKDHDQTRSYLEKNTNVYMAYGSTFTALGGSDDIENGSIQMNFQEDQRTNKSNNPTFLIELNDDLAKLTFKVNPGDEVYLVSFTAEGTNYELYMFVNPKTKVLLKEGSLFGLDIPLSYADYFSKNSKSDLQFSKKSKGNLQLKEGPLYVINKVPTTTLFEYGEPVKSSEANFRNLFKNFPKLITNAGEGLKLISYKYETEIKDQEQIKNYLEKNANVYIAYGGTFKLLGGLAENEKIKMEFKDTFQDPNRINTLSILTTLKEATEKMTGNIHPGDEVYSVNFIANGTNYEICMFVNPKTKVLLKAGSLFGFDIPVTYADYFSKKK